MKSIAYLHIVERRIGEDLMVISDARITFILKIWIPTKTENPPSAYRKIDAILAKCNNQISLQGRDDHNLESSHPLYLTQDCYFRSRARGSPIIYLPPNLTERPLPYISCDVLYVADIYFNQKVTICFLPGKFFHSWKMQFRYKYILKGVPSP